MDSCYIVRYCTANNEDEYWVFAKYEKAVECEQRILLEIFGDYDEIEKAREKHNYCGGLDCWRGGGWYLFMDEAAFFQ